MKELFKWACAGLLAMQMSNFAHFRTVSLDNSTINYPYAGALVNTLTPIITGTLCDENGQTLNDEPVTIFIDTIKVGAAVSGQEHGIFVFPIPDDAPLAEGEHVVTVQLDALGLTLNPVPFVVDVLPPAAPVIEAPLNNQIISSSHVIIAGSSEPHATIFLFLDSTDYADVIYADELGHWSVEYDLSSGVHTVYVHAESQAGNPGPNSITSSFTIA